MENHKQIIEEYLLKQTLQVQAKLMPIHVYFLQKFPQATQKIAYGIPTYYVTNNILHFSVYKNHIGFYPGTEAIEKFKHKFENCHFSKGTIQIPHDIPFPTQALKELIDYLHKKSLLQ